MRDIFSDYHPFINLVYFLAVIAFSMFFMHPVFFGSVMYLQLYLFREIEGEKRR